MDKTEDYKIAVTKDGKDLFRLIFVPSTDAKYDVKMCFLGKPYIIEVYQHFAYRPHRIDPQDSEDKEITYHHGQGSWPVLIHLKNQKAEEGQTKYQTILNVGLSAPTIQQMFPQPLFKIEIPQSLVDSSLPYHPKKGRNEIDIEDGNVIEFFLTRSTLDGGDFYNRYTPLFLVYSSLSIEYFCTNSAESGLEKSDAELSLGNVKDKVVGRTLIHGPLSIAASFFHHKIADSLTKCRVTLLQNDMAEDILLNTLYYQISGGLGFATKLQAQMSPHPTLLHPETAVAQTLKMGRLSPVESTILFHKSLLAESHLYEAMTSFGEQNQKEKEVLLQEATLFKKAILSIRDKLLARYVPGTNLRLYDYEAWFMSAYPLNSMDISLLFALHMKLDGCMLITRTISGPKVSSPSEEAPERDQNGHIILKVENIDLETITMEHTILGYDDYWDIDFTRDVYNACLDGMPFCREPSILITRGYLPNEGYEKDEIYQKLRASGYSLGPFVFQPITKGDLRTTLERNNLLMVRTLEAVEKEMKFLKEDAAR